MKINLSYLFLRFKSLILDKENIFLFLFCNFGALTCWECQYKPDMLMMAGQLRVLEGSADGPSHWTTYIHASKKVSVQQLRGKWSFSEVMMMKTPLILTKHTYTQKGLTKVLSPRTKRKRSIHLQYHINLQLNYNLQYNILKGS